MLKQKVAILTDSTANLPDEVIEKYGIHVIPLHVNWDGQSLLDGIDIQTEEFYERLAHSKSLPTTSQPSAGAFLEKFKEVAETAESIVGIFISDELSGTLASARAALDMMEDYPIEIVDTRSTSMGMGLMVIAAAEAIAAGKDYKEVAALVRGIVPRMRVMFVVDTLEYLHRGGRIGGAKRLIGSVLSIKPVLQLEDGKIEPLASIRTKKKAIRHMLDCVKDEMSSYERIHASVLHAVSTGEAEKIADALQQSVQPVSLVTGDISPVIGTHVGAGTLGIACYGE